MRQSRPENVILCHTRKMKTNKVNRLLLKNFTIFEDAEFNFCSGINVLIGANDTGKTHVLKVLYSILHTLEWASEENQNQNQVALENKLLGVFKPDGLKSLVKRNSIGGAEVVLGYGKTTVRFQITPQNTATLSYEKFSNPDFSLFLPPHEWLAVSEGFASLYANRELAFDETYYDFSLALDAPPLKGQKLKEVQSLLSLVQKAIGAKVEKRDGRFYLRSSKAVLEAHLSSEGYRKLAGIAYLISNGSLIKNSILFWDEPEANLNPKMIIRVVELLKELMDSGVQIFLATHDYLLSQELSLLSEYNPKAKVNFFSLYRPDENSSIVVNQGEVLSEVINNPILEEFAAHYDREVKLMDAEVSK